MLYEKFSTIFLLFSAREFLIKKVKPVLKLVRSAWSQWKCYVMYSNLWYNSVTSKSFESIPIKSLSFFFFRFPRFLFLKKKKEKKTPGQMNLNHGSLVCVTKWFHELYFIHPLRLYWQSFYLATSHDSPTFDFVSFFKITIRET